MILNVLILRLFLFKGVHASEIVTGFKKAYQKVEEILDGTHLFAFDFKFLE